MIVIKKIDENDDLKDLLKIIQDSFITVAKEFRLTKDIVPTNPAYLTLKKLEESIESGVEYFIAKEGLEKIGCIAIEVDKQNNHNYFIERLAVIPEKRHNKIGKKLLDYAISEIKKRNGTSAGVAIINKNIKLKNWYINYGFKEILLKNFVHLPFTVCFMKIVFK